MPRWKSRTLTEGELDFMNVLWKMGEMNPDAIQRELCDAGREVSGGTVRNLLTILREKGYVRRRKNGKTHLYSPTITREEARTEIADDMLTTAFGNSPSLMVKALFNARDIDPGELAEIERLIDEGRKESS